jgi:hypothetical protein
VPLQASPISLLRKCPTLSDDKMADVRAYAVEGTLLIPTVHSLAMITYPHTQTQFSKCFTHKKMLMGTLRKDYV